MSIKAITFAALAIVFSVNANASLITNGSLTGSLVTAGVPTGWNVGEGSPDTNNALNNIGGAAPFGVAPSGSSPDGGTFVGVASFATGGFESFWQDVSGLSIGTTYELSWFKGNFGAISGPNYLANNSIQVLIDGVSIGSGSALALGPDWSNDLLLFTATAAMHRIEFQLATGGVNSYLAIDGISLDSAVPVPAAVWLFASGLLGLVGMARRGSGRQVSS